jgi:DNA-binding GntR family transcriptional regulator
MQQRESTRAGLNRGRGAARSRTPAKTELIVARITAAIAEHRLPPGTKLGEESLGEIFRVSRTMVRQALFQLSRDRLVTLLAGRGAFVAQPSVREAREVFDARRIIERDVVARFARAARPEAVARLREHLAAESEAVGDADVQRRARLLGEFHVLIAEMAGNSVLAEVLKELVARTSLVLLLYQPAEASACSSDDHVAIVSSLERRQPDKAVALMIEHLEQVERGLNLRESEPEAVNLKSALTAVRI